MRRFVVAICVSSLALAGAFGCASSKKQKKNSAKAAENKKKQDEQNRKDEQARAEREKLEKRIEKLETQLERERQLAKRQKKLRMQLEDQLSDLVDAGKVQITSRRGMLVVRLPKQVLFESGKFKLKNEGKNALKSVASALGELEKHRVLVAGHTDDVPVSDKSVDFSNNWELSSMRALSAAQVLEASGVPPKKLGAAGFGSHDPIAKNNSDENRKKNRRVELMLVPDLTKVIQRAKAQGDMQKNTAESSGDKSKKGSSGSEG